MNQASEVLLLTAASVGFMHTLIGVDHSLPFVVLSRSQGWSLRRLWGVTALCGVGHVLSSALLGCVGIALGVALSRLEWIEEVRGGFAARLLIGFGLAYAIWGLYRALRNTPHRHVHAHADGVVHSHEHSHEGEHAHVHTEPQRNTLTAVALFLIFAFGPCEALIPLLIAPAFESHWSTVLGVVLVFGLATVGTMLALVTVGHLGLRWRAAPRFERFGHALAGFAICGSGAAIEWLGI